MVKAVPVAERADVLVVFAADRRSRIE